ncbi:type VII secretion integral membrane protein EccD [Cryptosporangium aurantiacum]|uniref:Type VII secretion integral membrane protein EccD n=1 Tax=Cryptosporangium aurantiacum TaxID=134849 RepID=A0A1M7NHW3_9ACTN|nr:type VII secretion integral membrane protein EccD [Cryptosporangium aurantiacum]SHN03377.1 type VII secretion integral membrane protein EccD [Cryptosporangium aurantiacum]
MSTTSPDGLARVTLAAPRRRVDLALPEAPPLAELLPVLLRHAGEGLADDGQVHGGWSLRRADGEPLDPEKPLAAQEIRDGEVLHLVPRRTEWPELDYDDLADAVAAGARRQGRAWSPAVTRVTGLAVAVTLLLAGLAAVLYSGLTTGAVGVVLLALSVLLAVLGGVVSRVLSDSVAGAVVAGAGLPYAFVGAAVGLAESTRMGAFGAGQVLIGSVALIVVAVVGYVAVGDMGSVFVGGIVAGLFGVLGGLLPSVGAGAAGATAVAVGLALLVAPALPLVAMRLGRVPLPTLPRSTDELMADAPPMPARRVVYAAVARSDDVLTGALFGVSLTIGVGSVLLARTSDATAAALVAVVASALMLRARLLATIRQRVPMLVAGLVGLGAVAVGLGDAVGPSLVLLGAGFALAAGLAYSRRPPSPYLGRLAELLDVGLVLAVVPLVCGVLGLFGYVRALGA